MYGYMTGWRVSSMLALRWSDVDLDVGTALSRAEDNKGKRDALVALHPAVVEHLRPLAANFGHLVFPWNSHRRTLWAQFDRIQKAAGVKPVGKASYGFHDLRRAFATLNADRMTADALQSLMQHSSYTTTQRYIAMARQLKPAVENLFVPNLDEKIGAG